MKTVMRPEESTRTVAPSNGAHAGQLDVARHAEAEQPVAVAGESALLRQALVVRHLQRVAKHGRVIAAVVDHVAGAAIVRQTHVVRHVAGLHEIGEAHGGAIAAGLARDQIHDALDDEYGLRLAGAPIRRHRHAMRVDAVERDVHGGDPVRPGQHRGGQERHDQAARGVGARVVREAIAQREQAALVVEADLDRVRLRAFLRGGQHVLEAILEPPHRPAQAQRQQRDQHVLGIDDQLGAEAAAHVRRQHAHAVRLEAEQFADELPHLVRHLRRGPHGQKPGHRVVLGDEPARLHRLAAAAPDAQAQARPAR